MSKRKCVFTGKESNYLAQIGKDKHNWAKKVPCTKEWWDANKDRPLTPNELELVELFFEQEIARLKIDTIEERMQKIRDGRVTILSAKEWDKLQEYLANPPERTPAFVEAMSDYQQLKQNGLKPIQFSEVTPEELEGLPDEFDDLEEIQDEMIEKTLNGIEKFNQNIKSFCEDSGIADKLYNKDLVINKKKENKLLTTSKKNDKVKKKVIKKKLTLWD